MRSNLQPRLRVGLRLASLGLALLVGLLGCKTPSTTVLLVRHAEKANGSNPGLTPAGQQRAQALVAVAQRAGIGTIYVSDRNRTQQTAAPLAAQLGLTPIVFPLGGDAAQHAQSLASDLLANHKDEGVLVVGHSDTVPLILQALGIPSPPTIAPLQFDALFVVVKKKNGPTRLVQARYGP